VIQITALGDNNPYPKDMNPVIQTITLDYGNSLNKVGAAMSIRFKLELLGKLGRSPSRGFVLPAAILLGLVVLIAGATILIRAQGDQTNVVSQKAKAASMASAETGISRLQNLMNTNRFIVTRPSSVWSAMTVSGGVVTNVNDPELANSLTTLAKAQACDSSDVTNKETLLKQNLAQFYTLASNGTANVFSNIDPNDPSKGQFRLVDYAYSGNTGILRIDGKTGSGGSQGTTRLAVDIPVTVTNPGAGAGVVPGLWLKKGGVNDGTTYETSSTTLGSNGAKFEANVYFTNCNSALSDSYVSAVQTNRVQSPGTVATKTDELFPSLPFQPTPAIATNVQSIGDVTLNGTSVTDAPVTERPEAYYYVINNDKGRSVTVSPPSSKPIYVLNRVGDNQGDIQDTTTLPKAGDIQSSDGKYRYQVRNIALKGNKNLTISTSADPDTTNGGANTGVVIYLNGDLDLRGSAKADGTYESTNTDDIAVSCSGGEAACSDKLHIYGYKDNGIACLRGNATTYGYILAPDYDLGKTGNGLFIGSLFGRSWGKIQNCGSNNGAVAVKQTANWSQVSTIRPTYLPKMGNFSAYKTQPVD